MSLFDKLKKLLSIASSSDPVETGVNQRKSSAKKNLKTNIFINTKTQKTMSMFNYGVGGNEVKVDANEAINEIQENKTLLVSKLTQDEPINPEIITGLKSVDEVFKYFKPGITVEQESVDGQTIKEDFNFGNLSDFSPKSITQQSPYLKNMHLQQEQYNKIVRQLKANKVLRTMLDDEQSKLAFVEALKAVAQQLESNN